MSTCCTCPDLGVRPPGQSLESAVASDNRGNMCRPQSRKNFNTEEAGRTTEGHGVRVQSASREAQFAFCSVVLRRPPCFLRVENLADVPPPRSPRRKTKGEPVRSHADAIQAIVLVRHPFGRRTASVALAIETAGCRGRTRRGGKRAMDVLPTPSWRGLDLRINPVVSIGCLLMGSHRSQNLRAEMAPPSIRSQPHAGTDGRTAIEWQPP